MTAAEFIEALESKQLLPAAMVGKLRKKVAANTSKPMTAKSLARFLIEKGYLSKQDAMTALAAGGEIEAPPPPEPSSIGEPSGVDLPMDQLQDLSSSAEWSIEETGGGFGEPEEATDGGPGDKKKKKKKKKQHKKGNEWDSPLLLIGGSALLLMLIIGGLIWVIMFAENADFVLAEARKGMQEGAYATAIEYYERFVEDYPGNAEYSKARVELAMARIRQTLETGNESRAFDTAETELRAIADEPDFNEAQEDLSDLLPRISRGLADDAEASEDPEETNTLAEKATAALGMANNTKYVPKSRRDTAELQEIRETLERIARRQQSLADLKSTLASIDQSIAEGETNAAYLAQEQLVEKHPSLIGNEQLAEAMVKISAAEQENIRFVEEPIEAATTPLQNAVVATLAIANRTLEGSAPASGVFAVEVDGIAYGLDAATGNLLWRRYIGPAVQSSRPLTVDDDRLLLEWRDSGDGQVVQTLVRVESGSGALQWRLDIDDQLAPPVLLSDKVLLAGASGKLHVVDAASGTRLGYVQFAQPLRTSPSFNSKSGVVYLPGERSSVYTLSARDFSCLGVHYTNHAREAIVAPVAVALDKVVLVENDAAKSCKVVVYGLDAQGVIDTSVAEERMAGRVVTQPLVEGRRVTVVTDRGQVGVYEVGVGSDGEPLTTLAMRAEQNTAPAVRYGTFADGFIWIGEDALSKYAIAPTGNRLTVAPLDTDYNRSRFVAPLEARDGVLFHTRSQRGRAGFTVTACDLKNGRPFWATDVGTPPAAGPLSSQAPLALLEADANGRVYRFDPEAIRTRIQTTALPEPESDADRTTFDSATMLAGGAAAFASSGSPTAVLYSPSAARPLSIVSLDSAIACRPTAMGNGWIVPLSVGQVFYLDARTGQALAAPFQPPLEAGRTLRWQPAAAVADDQLLISDGEAKVYLLEVRQEGTPVLAPAAEVELQTPLSSGFAVAGSTAVALARDGQLVTLSLPGLESGTPINPGGRVVWGPYTAGNLAVVATANSLMAIDGSGQLAWQVPMTTEKFAGQPLVMRDAMVAASESGAIVRINLADGGEVGRVEAGEPLAAGPVMLNNKLVVATRDSSLLVVDSP